MLNDQPLWIIVNTIITTKEEIAVAGFVFLISLISLRIQSNRKGCGGGLGVCHHKKNRRRSQRNGVGAVMKRSRTDSKRSSSLEDAAASSSPPSTIGGGWFQFSAPEMPECLNREKRQEPQTIQRKAEQDLIGIHEGQMEISYEVIRELEERIQSIEHKPAWDLAMEMDPEYPRTLMVPFLRSVEGSAKKASKRIVLRFETKLDLFGSDKLVRPIEMDDFDEYDLEALNCGGFQVLPQKDRAGRPLLFGRYTSIRCRDVKNMVRAAEL